MIFVPVFSAGKGEGKEEGEEESEGGRGEGEEGTAEWKNSTCCPPAGKEEKVLRSGTNTRRYLYEAYMCSSAAEHMGALQI